MVEAVTDGRPGTCGGTSTTQASTSWRRRSPPLSPSPQCSAPSSTETTAPSPQTQTTSPSSRHVSHLPWTPHACERLLAAEICAVMLLTNGDRSIAYFRVLQLCSSSPHKHPNACWSAESELPGPSRHLSATDGSSLWMSNQFWADKEDTSVGPALAKS